MKKPKLLTALLIACLALVAGTDEKKDDMGRTYGKRPAQMS